MKESTELLKAGYNLGFANIMLKDVIGRLETIMEESKYKSSHQKYQDVINQIQSASLFIEKCTE